MGPAGGAEVDGSNDSSRTRPLLATIAVWLLVAIALIVLGVPAVSTTRTSWHDSEPHSPLRVASIAVADGFACAAAAVRAGVPPGSVAYIREDQPGPYHVLWYQRLVEMTYPYATLVSDPAEADVEVEILEVPADQGCDGALVHVKQLR